MKRWVSETDQFEAATILANEGGLPLSFARVACARGLCTLEALQEFCNPRLAQTIDPFDMTGMESACQLLAAALKTGRRMVVFGDYDADGITSTALLVKVLQKLGGDVQPFIPKRLDDGYGLSQTAVERCLQELKPEVLITVDCGTNAVDRVAYMQDQGVQVIVTDHHEPAAQPATPDALINPKLDERPSLRMLAGVGVTFKLCHGLVKWLRRQDPQTGIALDLRPYLYLVALGTVCDVVPLQHENRIFTACGLQRLNGSPERGISSLIAQAGIRTRQLSAYHLGFQLGPRLNAAGRLGDARTSLDLLLTEDPREAVKLAAKLDAYNRNRQEEEKRMVAEACEQIEQSGELSSAGFLIAHSDTWHPGVVGIAASRIVARYRLPAAVIATGSGVGRGSCRSIDGINVVGLLQAAGRHLTRYGGHAMAAGFEMPLQCLADFQSDIDRLARDRLAGVDCREVLRIDHWLTLDQVTEDLANWLDRLRPFGVGNLQPVFAVKRATVFFHKIIAEKHLRLGIDDGTGKLSGIRFNCLPSDIPAEPLDVVFTLQFNEFAGRRTLEMQVKDMRTSQI